MFRDREKALQELQKQLLEREEEALPDEESQEERLGEVYDEYAQNVRAYNSDTADTELDSYSDEIYEDPRHNKTGCILWLVLLLAGVLLALSYFLAKQGGLL